MTNIALNSIDKYLDVAAKNAYHSFHLKESVERRLERIHVSTRDSARTPVQWTGGRAAGFTTGKPWFYVNPNYTFINAEAEEKDPLSILNFYRRCLLLRKSSETLLWGTYREYFPLSRKLFMFERKHKKDAFKTERILVICSFHAEAFSYRLPKGYDPQRGRLILDNYISEKDLAAGTYRRKKDAEDGGRLSAGRMRRLLPYEAQVWRF